MLFLLEEHAAVAREHRVDFIVALGSQETPEDQSAEFGQRLVYEKVLPLQLEPPRHHTAACTVACVLTAPTPLSHGFDRPAVGALSQCHSRRGRDRTCTD